MSGTNLKSRSLLAGVLFDADGHRMIPTHAVKKGMRYRHYVSRSLITGDGKTSPNARRVPANEIEHLVMTRIRAFLCDEAQMLDALSTSIQDPAILRRLITKAQQLGEACPAKINQDREGNLRSVINRIDVHVDKVDLYLSPARLCNVLEEKVLRSDSPVEPESSASVINLTIPVRLRRAGRELRMILTATDTRIDPRKPDLTLINLIARANALHRKLVASGSSIAELAASEGLHYSHVSRLVRLAFLSPEITEAIVQGQHPIDLTAKKLLRVSRIPIDWHDQRAVLGFE